MPTSNRRSALGSRTGPRTYQDQIVNPEIEAFAPVADEELTATVARMQERLSESKSPMAHELMQLYGQLASRFEQDLASSRRDVYLAKASALMLVQAAAHAERAP